MRLPAFEDLSLEQDEILNLPLDGKYVVSGPPGTGKSVLALYRAQALDIDDRSPLVLMFSNVLKQYTQGAASELQLEGRVDTFHRWIKAFWNKHYHSDPPTVAGDRWTHDWQAMTEAFMARPVALQSIEDLLVDEGQDLPPDFYRFAGMLGQNITVFADENQQLREKHSSLTEIAGGLAAKGEHRLTKNYRNTREIALLAERFYTGLSTGKPDLPIRRGDKPTARSFPNLNVFVDDVAKYVRMHSDRTIGIACQYSRQQSSLLNRLNTRELPVPVETYIGKSPAHRSIQFDRPGVLIVNYESLKGLEFDTLFVPELETLSVDPTAASIRMKFYVITSRARRELHLSWNGSSALPDILRTIPAELMEIL